MVAKDYISNPRMGSILQPKVYLPATSTKNLQQPTEDNLHRLQQKVLEQRSYYDDEEETQEPEQLEKLNLVDMFRNEDDRLLKQGRSLEVKPKRNSYDESKLT